MTLFPSVVSGGGPVDDNDDFIKQVAYLIDVSLSTLCSFVLGFLGSIQETRRKTHKEHVGKIRSKINMFSIHRSQDHLDFLYLNPEPIKIDPSTFRLSLHYANHYTIGWSCFQFFTEAILICDDQGMMASYAQTAGRNQVTETGMAAEAGCGNLIRPEYWYTFRLGARVRAKGEGKRRRCRKSWGKCCLPDRVPTR